jgi:hypothetical protein
MAALSGRDVMDVCTRRIIGFGVAPADLDGPAICRIFNRVIAKQTPPQYLSSDNDPLFRFHRCGGQTFGYWKLMRSKPFPVRHFPIPSLNT